MADPRMTAVMAYLRPTLAANPLPGVSAVKEFAEFWRSCSEEEKQEFADGIPTA